MTYLSVIAAAGAAALVAAHAEAATGQTSGKRIHKPLAVSKTVDQVSPKLAARGEIDKASPKLFNTSPKVASGVSAGRRMHKPLAKTGHGTEKNQPGDAIVHKP